MTELQKVIGQLSRELREIAEATQRLRLAEERKVESLQRQLDQANERVVEMREALAEVKRLRLRRARLQFAGLLFAAALLLALAQWRTVGDAGAIAEPMETETEELDGVAPGDDFTYPE